MKALSMFKVVASLFAAAVVIHPAYADAVFEENFPTASEAEADDSADKLAELEKSFWICDYTATTHGVGLNDGVVCGIVTDELKRAKFSNDFEQLVDWWRLNKYTQHEALKRVSTALANAESDGAADFPDSI